MLFGHQNNDDKQPAPEPAPVSMPTSTINPLAVDPTTGVSLPVAPVDPSMAQNGSILAPPAPPALSTPPIPAPPAAPNLDAPSDASADQATGTAPTVAPIIEPVSLDTADASFAPPVPPAPETVPPIELAPQTASEPAPAEEPPVMQLDEAPAQTQEAPQTPELAPELTPDEPAAAESPVVPDDLLALKQQALEQLTPLVDELDQSPEERFRTKMMMIQSTDNQALIKDAYEAAQAIPDEKVRAQALLDIINEINYFTAPQH